MIVFLCTKALYALTHPLETADAIKKMIDTVFHAIHCLATTTFKVIKIAPRILIEIIKIFPTILKGCIKLACYVLKHPGETMLFTFMVAMFFFAIIIDLIPRTLRVIIENICIAGSFTKKTLKNIGHICIMKPIRYGLSFIGNPWQKIKNVAHAVRHPKQCVSLQLTRLLQKLC